MNKLIKTLVRPFNNKFGFGDNNQETGGLGKVGNYFVFAIILIIVVGLVTFFVLKSKTTTTSIKSSYTTLEGQLNTAGK